MSILTRFLRNHLTELVAPMGRQRHYWDRDEPQNQTFGGYADLADPQRGGGETGSPLPAVGGGAQQAAPPPGRGAPPGGVPAGGYGTPGQSSADDPRGMIPVIRAAAIRYGHDPDIAVRVARSEGLGNPTGDHGASHGAFQLYTGGGLGNEFMKANPGVDLSDPKNEPMMIDYSMKNLNRTGWEPYHGAARTAGVNARDGISVNQPDPSSVTPNPVAANSAAPNAAQAPNAQASPSAGSGGVLYPVTGSMTSGYGAARPAYTGHSGPVAGHVHAGVDLSGELGSAVGSTQGGTVLPSSGWHNGYGNTVDILHADGAFERHAHLANPMVKAGDTVTPGQQLGAIGPEGHDHFEMHSHYDYKNAGNNYGRTTTTDPSEYFQGLKQGQKFAGGQSSGQSTTQVASASSPSSPSSPPSSTSASGNPAPVNQQTAAATPNSNGMLSSIVHITNKPDASTPAPDTPAQTAAVVPPTPPPTSTPPPTGQVASSPESGKQAITASFINAKQALPEGYRRVAIQLLRPVNNRS